MATGSNYSVEGLGAGDMTWPKDFTLKNDSGTAIFKVTGSTVDTILRSSQRRVLQAGAKVGATAGWVIDAADNKNSLGRCPASQTASTLVVPVTGLKVGDIVTGVHLLGQIESAGGSVTVDMSLRKQTAAAADLTDASVGSMTQLVVTADTIISSANSGITALSDTVGADETFYVLITATTAASTDIDLQGIAITVTEY